MTGSVLFVTSNPILGTTPSRTNPAPPSPILGTMPSSPAAGKPAGPPAPAKGRRTKPDKTAGPYKLTKLYKHNGETRTIKGWAEHLGIDRTTILTRLARGWTLEETLSKRSQQVRRNHAPVAEAEDD